MNSCAQCVLSAALFISIDCPAGLAGVLGVADFFTITSFCGLHTRQTTYSYQDVPKHHRQIVQQISTALLEELYVTYIQGEHVTLAPDVTFVDISAMRGDFCMTFYTAVKQENINFNTKFC